MTTLIDDPLIAAMTIDRMLPLHESSRRLRELVLDALVSFGLPVRGPWAARRRTRNACEIRAALPMLLASSDR